MKVQAAVLNSVVRADLIEKLRTKQTLQERELASGYLGKDIGLGSSLPPSRHREELTQRDTQYV